MTADSTARTPAAAEAPQAPRRVDTAIPSRRERSVPHAGWIVVAGKEFADYLWSIRFVVLLFLLGIVALIPMYFAADTLRGLASQITNQSSVFLFLFSFAPQIGGSAASQDAGFQIPSALDFVRIVGPLLGVIFAFDAVNGERSDGTLPRLLSQPIFRDDVINGKFAAAISAIGLVLVLVVGIVTAFGVIRLGVVPSAEALLRITVWVIITMLYVGIWLAFGILLSVAFRRAATSALVGFGVWALLTLFGGFIVGIVNSIVAPITGTLEQQASAYGLQQTITRFLPGTIYQEASVAMLNPQVAAVSNPDTIGGFEQAAQRIPSVQNFDQSLLLVWPHLVVMLAITVGLFALAYVQFMRQEVRA